ncbi:diguanylate cyclase (GGDEF)-like protein/PAS domain S-box-containing protein [Marinobacter sp. MBR-99]|jgi:diguanylate cyclase (GGDEF)-like protein/PAS domain S-box-containing protein|uniref:sensor domain-containing diguanylate cyclase n=1 Tax=Marinobacter sp. MBR-99 TaxID=3156461 RepID=UPI003396B3FA
MDILEQKRRIITTAIVAVVLTGIIIAAVVSAPLINQIHTQAAQTARGVADAKAENVRAVFDQHQDLARQTASRSELARVLGQFAKGEVSTGVVQTFSRPRLQDAARIIDDLAVLIRYDASGNELVRVGPWANELPAAIPLSDSLDINTFTLVSGDASGPLLQAVSPIQADGQVVGYDQLIFLPESMARVFQIHPDSSLCLLNSQRTKRLTFNPDTDQLELAAPGGCLAERQWLSTRDRPGSFRATLDDGSQVLTFHRPLAEYGWEVHMYTRTSQVFANVIFDILISVLAILVLSTLAGVVVWQSLRPIVGAMVKQTSQIARSTEELRLAYQVFEHTHEAILITDAHFVIVRANPAFSDITGAENKALRGKPLTDFLDSRPGKGVVLRDIRKQLVTVNAWQGEVWVNGHQGLTIPNLMTVSPVRNKGGQIQQLVLTFSNITERVQAERQMVRLAHFDELTGLPNRVALENHLEQAIQQARRENGHFALMFLDLDKFKPVKDTYGHQVGDELLRNVGKRLKHCIRSSDVVGRRGGDEFVVITGPLHGDDDAKPIADKIVAVLNDTFHIQGHNVQIGASVGVALYPDDGLAAEDLLKQADAAMYRVKTSGRNAVAYA